MADKMKRKDLDNILKNGFSWKKIAGYHIPFIIRSVNGRLRKFVATRMAEYELLKKLLHNKHSYIYTSFTPVIAYVITDSEAKILNYINETHYRNGKNVQFLAGIDYIVSLDDMYNFYLFIDTCYKKILCNFTSGDNDKCGFVRINFDPNSCVPYCTQNGQKYLPLFYFVGNTEHLKQRALKLEKWNLAYLKFCCILYGVKAEFFGGDSCLVVNLDDIKNLYPSSTHFGEFWPGLQLFTSSTVLANQESFRTNPPGYWFRVVRKAVPDQNTIYQTSTSLVTTAPHGTQVMEDRMEQQQKQQQQKQIITTLEIQAQENNSNNAQYKIKMAILDGKTIHCINAKAHLFSDWMVTLKDLVWMVLPSCNVAKCAHILHTFLKITILFGKSEQLAVLKENGLIRSMNPGDTPMAMLKDVTLVLPQLKTFVLMQDKELQVDLPSDNISAKNLPGTGEASRLSEAMSTCKIEH